MLRSLTASDQKYENYMLGISERLARCCHWVLQHPNFETVLDGVLAPKLKASAERLIDYSDRFRDADNGVNTIEHSDCEASWLASRLSGIERIPVEYWNCRMTEIRSRESRLVMGPQKIDPLPRNNPDIRDEWTELSEYVKRYPALQSIELSDRRLPLRARKWVDSLEQPTLLAIYEHDYHGVSSLRNFGTRSIRSIADSVRRVISKKLRNLTLYLKCF